MIAAHDNPVIEKAYVELKRLSSDEEAQKLAEDREKALRDEYARNKHAYNKGKAEGKAEGKEEGKIEDAINIILDYNATVTKAMATTNLPESARQRIIQELERNNIPYIG